MSDRVIRPLRDDELRAATTLFNNAMHSAAPTEYEWKRGQRGHQPDRALGAFDGDALIGSARSVDAAMAVPGGSRVPVAAVTGVAVRADRTRRGVLRELMRHQLDELSARGVPLAALYASEATIYGRFGYGAATSERSLRIDRRRAKVRSGAPRGGEITLHDLDDAQGELPAIYESFADHRPGAITRPSYLWPAWEAHYHRSPGLARLAVHHGMDGIDGYAMYRVHDDESAEARGQMYVEDMRTRGGVAFAELWRFLLSVDLVDRITARSRPLDEPIEALLDDPSIATVYATGDDLWLRLVDVEAALAARRYQGSATVVLEVRDELLPSNSSCYELSASGVRRTDRPAQLRLGVDSLAMLYLGGWQVEQLIMVGRVDVADPAGVDAARSVLATADTPWCGTFF